MRLIEEIVLLLLDDDRGDLAPGLSKVTLNVVLAGAVLMDLALDNRIDTDLARLVLLDGTPLDDDLLDPSLAAIAREPHEHDAGFWVRNLAAAGDRLLARAQARLLRRGILESTSDGPFFLTRRVFRARRYPPSGGKQVEEVRLRVMRVLFSDDIPDPREIAIICLADAADLFRNILSGSELEQVRERIDLVTRMDLIGQSVTQAVRELEGGGPGSPAARSSPEIPAAPGLPLVGNAFAMAGSVRAFLARHYLNLGPVFRVRALNRRFVALVGPEANLFLANDGKALFRSYELWLDFNAEVGTMRTIVSMDGAEHMRMRKVQGRAYSRRRIEERLADVVEVTRREIDSWPRERPVTGQYAFQRIVCEQLGAMTASMSPRGYVDDLIVYLEMLLKTRVARQRPALTRYLPRVRRARRRLAELYAEVVAAHAPERRRGKSPDLIDDLLELHRADPLFLPETDLPIALLGPFIVTLDTVGSTCAFMLYALLKHPELLRRMRAEVDAFFDRGQPTAAGLRQLDVTHRIALETLRLYPVIPGLIRTAANSFEFAGYTVPAGTEVLIGNTVPHHLPEYFPDPQRFDIDRYTPDRAEHRRRGAYAPFGAGPHRCLGSSFAEVQIMLTMATVVREAELALDRPGYSLKVKQVPNPRPADSFRFRVAGRRGGRDVR